MGSKQCAEPRSEFQIPERPPGAKVTVVVRVL